MFLKKILSYKCQTRAIVTRARVPRQLCLIDAETAEAGSKKDLDMIFAAVRTLDGGFHTLNAAVLDQMRQMITSSMVSALATTGLRFEPLPVDYRTCCCASESDREEWPDACQDLFESGCSYDDGGDDDNRLKFGNWWRQLGSTSAREEMSICDEHYRELSKMQRRKWKPIKCVADLGSDAEKYKEAEHELAGEVVGVTSSGSLSVEARETAATAASLLIQSTKLLSETGQIETAAWNPQEAGRKALELRKRVYGERDVRTAEAMTELSRHVCPSRIQPSHPSQHRPSHILCFIVPIFDRGAGVKPPGTVATVSQPKTTFSLLK